MRKLPKRSILSNVWQEQLRIVLFSQAAHLMLPGFSKPSRSQQISMEYSMVELTPIQREFRAAMPNLPAAVNIVTTDGPHGRCGITVSAVGSVTDSPPTVLVCINQSSATHDVFNANGRICVNVLSSTQEKLAMHFSGAIKVPIEERFSWDIWSTPVLDESGRTHAPVLRDAHVNLFGRIADRKVIGSHSVLFVELDAVQTKEEGDTLVYFGRKFHQVSVEEVADAPTWEFCDEWSDPSALAPQFFAFVSGGTDG